MASLASLFGNRLPSAFAGWGNLPFFSPLFYEFSMQLWQGIGPPLDVYNNWPLASSILSSSCNLNTIIP